jgi:trigger factor
MAEVVQETVEEISAKALEERNERPAFRPAISLSEEETVLERLMDKKADLEFTMAFEVLPKIELTDFKALKVEKPVAEISAEEVDEALSNLQKNYTNYDPKEGAAEDGDRVTADFVGKIDGEPFEGGSAEGAHVILGGHTFIPGFEEGLMGAVAGEERNVEVTFPEDYGAKHLAGKPATFEVKVTEVGTPKLPELNDEFAETLGLESIDKLKDALRDRIGKDYHSASRDKTKRSLLDALDTTYKFELPPSLLENEFESIWQDVTSRLKKEEKTFEGEGTTEEKARAEYRTLAERRVRLGLVLSEIGQANNITVSDEEVRRAIMQRASQFPGHERDIVEYFTKNPNASLELRAPIFEEKVVDYLLELADVTTKTVTPEELLAPDEDEASGNVCGPDCDHDQ